MKTKLVNVNNVYIHFYDSVERNYCCTNVSSKGRKRLAWNIFSLSILIVLYLVKPVKTELVRKENPLLNAKNS